MSAQDTARSSSFTPLAATLAGALATPALFLMPMGASAQQAPVSTLAPVEVHGEAPAFAVEQSASSKFTAPLLDTAKSVQVIPQAVIQSQAASSLTQVLRNTPGITFGSGEGGNPLGDRPFIRGFDAQSSTFVDGMRDIGASSREVFNLEQVEVIRGSDGAFGGRGGAGGSINLISKTAKADNFNNASLGLGTDNYYRGTLDTNRKLSDTTAFRLNAMYHKDDVAGRDVVDNKRWGIAPTITFGLNTPTRLTLSYYHLSTDDTPDSGIPYAYPSTKIKRDGSFMGVTETGPADVDRHNFYGLTSDYRETRSDMATIALEHDLTPDLTVSNKTRYTYNDQEYVVTQPDDSQGNVLNGLVWRRANTRVSDVNTIANQTELTGSLQTGSLKHRFATGLEFSRESSKKDSLNVNRGNGASCANGVGAASNYNCTSLYWPNPHDPWVNTLNGEAAGANTKSRTITKSIYAFDTIEFHPQWQANLGLRVDDYSTRFTNTPANNSTQVERDDTLVNYQLGLVYKPAPNGSVYASFGTSSTPANASLGEGSESQSIVPGRGGVGLNAADMAPEKNKTYEIGTKWAVLDSSLNLSAAIFRTETTNARITLPSGDYAMAGNREVNGLELAFAGNLTRKWQVFGGYTLMDSEITDGGPAGTDEGNEFPNTPRHSLSLWSTYNVTPKATVGGGVYYVGKQYGNTTNTTYIPSYWRVDAMAAYEINRNWNVQLNVFNLFNETYYDKSYPAHYATLGLGRSAVLSVNMQY